MLPDIESRHHARSRARAPVAIYWVVAADDGAGLTGARLNDVGAGRRHACEGVGEAAAMATRGKRGNVLRCWVRLGW